jgi:siderophore synthetase component
MAEAFWDLRAEDGSEINESEQGKWWWVKDMIALYHKSLLHALMITGFVFEADVKNALHA